MAKLIVLRGISGSGKSTYAEQLRRDGYVIVSRDHIREMFKDYQSVDEDLVSLVEDTAIQGALRAGHNVVVDNTNIRLKYIRRFAQLAQGAGADFDVKQFDIDVNAAIARVGERYLKGGRDVPEGVIRKQHQSLKSSKLNWDEIYQPEVTFEKYVPDFSLPPAILVDVDGTLAHNDGHRDWYDYSKVKGDLVHEHIRDIVRHYYDLGYVILIMSGRDDECEDLTTEWLDMNDIPWDYIFMRKTGDMRKDAIVKMELFDTHIRGQFNVRFALDDRNQVVEAWRSVGLPCLQVAPGDF